MLLGAKSEEQRDSARRQMEVILRTMRDPMFKETPRVIDGSADDAPETTKIEI